MSVYLAIIGNQAFHSQLAVIAFSNLICNIIIDWAFRQMRLFLIYEYDWEIFMKIILVSTQIITIGHLCSEVFYSRNFPSALALVFLRDFFN